MKWIFLCSIATWFIACSDCEPLSNPGNQLVISFFNKENFEADSTFVPQPLNLNISANAIAFVADTSSQASYKIPLPLEEEQVTLLFDYPDTLIKTFSFNGEEQSETITDKEDEQIDIIFSKYFEPVSPDCGVIIRYKDLKISSSSLESEAEVVFDFIENNDSTNIRIFF